MFKAIYWELDSASGGCAASKWPQSARGPARQTFIAVKTADLSATFPAAAAFAAFAALAPVAVMTAAAPAAAKAAAFAALE